MVFSSPIFLFIFLPAVLVCCLFKNLRLRNFWLLLFSIFFYAWGEFFFVFLMLGSTIINYFLGRWVDRETETARRQRAVAAAIVFNVGTLAALKYANFAVDNLNVILGWAGLGSVQVGLVRLPIGISFFTFHALSYVVDIYRRKCPAAKNPADVALYIFFFPQLIAGPILRWSAIAPQIAHRVVTRSCFVEGIRQFTVGLAKKMLIANAVAKPADQIFNSVANQEQLTAPVAWVGAICYTLQIYFDFSGYSDMACGLGKMFGFKFMENFNYPYVSKSVREFWRRWHISLSSWFRDYVYIPLGGNQCSAGRNHLNLLIVFFLCGLWHGASWTFVLWGLYHGAFLVLERSWFGKALERLVFPLPHIYTLVVVLVGWVLFRAETLSAATAYLKNMAGIHSGPITWHPLRLYLTNQVMSMIIAGCIFATPIWPWLKQWTARTIAALPQNARWVAEASVAITEVGLYAGLLLLCAVWLAGGTYNPFIYFRF